MTVVRHPNETAEQCDDRVLRRLQVEAGSSAVTLTVYNPTTGEFTKLKPAADV